MYLGDKRLTKAMQARFRRSKNCLIVCRFGQMDIFDGFFRVFRACWVACEDRYEPFLGWAPNNLLFFLHQKLAKADKTTVNNRCGTETRFVTCVG